jgi:hypothetical protein
MRIFKPLGLTKAILAGCLIFNASPGQSQDILDLMNQDAANLE